ncbi:hypothetical protein [Paraburkholderia sp. J11-2]|uniref:hypothetical protein n=1 Tax=Paraburkholderia sp. J11-2 TaxID=2805431 RepID=UPI002AB7B05E|nr:hypothetical protein [Paraburkholderia sp. J11-2]
MDLPVRIPGRNGFKYRPQYGVIVVCRNEAEQRSIYEALRAQGHKVKVVCV